MIGIDSLKSYRKLAKFEEEKSGRTLRTVQGFIRVMFVQEGSIFICHSVTVSLVNAYERQLGTKVL